MTNFHKLGIDIGSTTVKAAILDPENHVLFSAYERHYANIQGDPGLPSAKGPWSSWALWRSAR